MTLRREKIRTIKKTFSTKRQAFVFQKSLRENLFSSLSVYAFNSYTYSRYGYKAAFHWNTKIQDNILIIEVTRVRAYHE